MSIRSGASTVDELWRAEERVRRRGVAVYGARGWVVRWIGGQVKAGRWGPGDVLPGERGLAEEIGVARETLRQALNRLERAGLLVRCGTDGRRRRFALGPPGAGKRGSGGGFRGSGAGPPETPQPLKLQ